MKAAFPYWNNRIAAVFDTAQQIQVVEAEDGRVLGETRETLSDGPPAQRVLHLVDLGVGALVCGAISRPMHTVVESYGIRVTPFVAGDLPEVVEAWLNGTLAQDIFSMPGCCGRSRRRQTRRAGMKPEAVEMAGKGCGGTGRGGGQGRGRSGQGRGRMGGPMKAVSAGTCICPQCGFKEAHEQGTPCMARSCPKCGIALESV